MNLFFLILGGCDIDLPSTHRVDYRYTMTRLAVFFRQSSTELQHHWKPVWIYYAARSWIDETKRVAMRFTSNLRFMALVAICLGLNLAIGLVMTAARLPLYLDSIGTLLATVLGGLWVGILSGLLSSIIGSAFTPTLWAYAGTMVAIAVYTSLVRPLGYLNKLLRTAIWGVGLGVVCAITSAPVTAYLWKGVSLSGTDSITASFMAKGCLPLPSVIFASLSTDPIDKLVASLVALALLKMTPATYFGEPALRESADA